MRKKLYPSLASITASLLASCMSIGNTRYCSVAGVMAAGMNCGNTLTDETYELDMNQMIEFLEPQPEKPDPDNPGQTLPARSGAICQSIEDWNKQKTWLEQACRKLGKRCSYEIEQTVRAMDKASKEKN